MRAAHRLDTLSAILEAPDREELLDWLRRRPLVVQQDRLLLVHAGLLPSWTPEAALALSREVEAVLASPAYTDFLRQLYGDEPARWDEPAHRPRPLACHRQRLHAAALLLRRTTRWSSRRSAARSTRRRDLRHGLAHPQRKSAQVTILCGHWSTLDLMLAPNVMMLDSGCLWGGTLTAVRLDDRRVFQVPSRAAIDPKPARMRRAAPAEPCSASGSASRQNSASPKRPPIELGDGVAA